MRLSRLTAIFCIAAFACAGCGTHYVTPAGGVALAETVGGDADIASHYERRPASPFPANVAVIRVQGAGYETGTNRGYGTGELCVVTTRDVERDEDFDKLARMPMVAGVAPVGRLLLPPNADSIRDLRAPAAQLRADLLLLYSIDTTFSVDGQSLGPLSLISLGFLPNKEAHVTSTVAGVLVDVRSGYVYGSAEATRTERQRATVWSTQQAIEASRLDAESAAFAAFVDEFGDLWSGVLDTYAATAPATPANTVSGWYYSTQP